MTIQTALRITGYLPAPADGGEQADEREGRSLSKVRRAHMALALLEAYKEWLGPAQ